MTGNAFGHPGEVVSGESPLERLGEAVITALESGETVGDLVEVGEVVRGNDFAARGSHVLRLTSSPGLLMLVTAIVAATNITVGYRFDGWV